MQPNTTREKEIWEAAFRLGQFESEEAYEVVREIHDALLDKRHKNLSETFWFEALDRLLNKPDSSPSPTVLA
ncbi:MAG: hypothetical protein ACFB10_19250 [Salibacteraceae bacterium]